MYELRNFVGKTFQQSINFPDTVSMYKMQQITFAVFLFAYSAFSLANY